MHDAAMFDIDFPLRVLVTWRELKPELHDYTHRVRGSVWSSDAGESRIVRADDSPVSRWSCLVWETILYSLLNQTLSLVLQCPSVALFGSRLVLIKFSRVLYRNNYSMKQQ